MRITQRITEPVFNFGGKAFCPLIGPAADLGGTTHQWVAHIVIPAGQSFPAHYHKLAEETYYILRGTALMVVDGERVSLGPGQAILLMPGEVHDLACADGKELEAIAMSCPPYDPQDVFLP